MTYTLASYLDGVRTHTIDPSVVISEYLSRAKEKNGELNAFVRFHDDYIAANQEQLLKLPFAGAPIAVKDIFMTKGYETTCASRILAGYIPPYSATSFQLCEDAGYMMIGKANMDEFAMGSSGETSAYGPARNPLDPSKTPGGSSSGSAVAVAADMCLAALGTDTGGSCRLPAAFCGIVGAKPTYGSISRYGVQPMANSLDQVGTLTKTVEDAVLLLNTMIEHDAKDATSVPRSKIRLLEDRPLSSYRIAVPDFAFGEGIQPEIAQLFGDTIAMLRSHGIQIDTVSLPTLAQGVSIYYVLCPAEVSSNMARFDGIKYGLTKPSDQFDDLYSYISDVRNQGFGDEVKRRIALGAYILRSENRETHYNKALAMREAMKQELSTLYETYDCVMTPTSPEFPWALGEAITDPLRLYMADLFTIPANLCELPAISVPMINHRHGVFPLGLHVMGSTMGEDVMMTFAQHCQNLG